MTNDRDDRGRFVEDSTVEDVLGVLRRSDEPMTATDVGTELGVSNRTTLTKLDALHERGEVRRKEVGARAVVWWVSDEVAVEAAIDPDDPFWSADPVPAGGPTDVAENVDAYLYGSPDENE